MVSVRPAAILAKSRCLALAAPLEGAPFEPNGEVQRAISEAYDKLGPMEPPQGWDPDLLSLWYATVYGGLVLMYTCSPVTPISRIFVDDGIELAAGSGSAPRAIDDSALLAAWAKMWGGMELEGLKELEGPLYYPQGYSWRAGGKVRFAVRGIVY